MKITHVTPGLITIPPNGWGAIEKVIWNYHLNLQCQGHESEIKYLNEVDRDSDIIHIHVANLAIEAHKMGIPYIFSLHDHHVVEYGRDSELYQLNLKAIKNSTISFCHAEFLVDYFIETDKLFYLSHGVDTKFFDDSEVIGIPNHKILCLANNGFAYNQSIDRKGFRYAIEAARELDLEITVAGPDNNKNFFDSNPDLLEYEKLTVIYGNPDEESIKKLYNTHTIFAHPSILEAGHPNLTLLEAMSCGRPTVGTYDGTPKIGGLRKIERSTESVVSGLKYVIENWGKLFKETQETRFDFDWHTITERLVGIYKSVKIINKNYKSEDTKTLLIDSLTNTVIQHIEPRDNVSFNINFVKNPMIEIKGSSSKKFRVEFWSGSDLVFQSMLGVNMWSKLSDSYYKDYICKIYDGDNLVYEHKINLTNKRVYIAFESESLGDTLAWLPQCDEFRKKHNCELIVSTFINELFINQYPEIKFVRPGDVVHDIYAMYRLGWFYDGDNINTTLNPRDFRKIPLQQTASDILGLEYKEVRPKLETIRNEILNFETYNTKWLEDVETEIFDFNEYNYGSVTIERGDVVVDLGANIGVFALYALHRKASKVFCVEPYIPYVKTILKNLNKFSSKVVISPIAISDVEGEVQINVNYENNVILSNVYEDYSWSEKLNETDMVKTMRFDDYLNVNNIEFVDFLKVDIEGSEYRLFKDVSVETLQKRVNKIAIEYHWNYSDQLNVITNKLNEAGFEISTFESNSNDRIGKLYAVNIRYKDKPKKRKVGIGIHSTSQAKYWNNPTGWQEVVDYLRHKGYEVMIYSREDDGFMGNQHPYGTTKFKGGELQEVINDLSECEFFIGLGSGLSWLAWSCKLPVVLISGFSEKWSETTLDTYRVINENVCHGCFNNEKLDGGDWNWCPLLKGTDRQYECTKEITSEMVIKEINKIIG